MTNNRRRLNLFLPQLVLLGIILLAFFLRVWQFPHVPPGLWYDEAYNALDAEWMAKTGQIQPFVVGNNGREALLHLLMMVSISVLGPIPFAVRLVSTLAGVLTVPLMARFAGLLAGPFVPERPLRRWFGVAAAGWLAVSWWHLQNSRSGLRPVLLPLLLIPALYFLLRGYQCVRAEPAAGRTKSFGLFALAGLFFGLAQYTYLPARLLPLVIGLLALLWSLLLWRQTRARLLPFWLGMALTGLVAALVFLPLGLFYIDNPSAFSSRTGDVFFAPRTLAQAAAHLLTAISLFLGAGHELYRHHLPGRAMLGWLEIPLFWLGLIHLLHPGRLKRPETQLLLIGFGVLWLPALLASPPVHSLRPIGLQPLYIVVVTLGTVQLARWLLRLTRRGSTFSARQFGVTAALLIGLTGVINGYDYFWRWANHPEVYKEYNGPLADLTSQIIELTRSQDVIIPFYLYAHPTTRFLLGDAFTEVDSLPAPASRPTSILLVPERFQLLYVANIPDSPALALLTRDEAGRGQVLVSRMPRAGEQEQINAALAAAYPQAQPFVDRLGRTLAQWLPLPTPTPAEFTALFTDTAPRRAINLNWGDQLQLTGYEVSPELARPGQPLTLNLYWHSLTDKSFDQRLFLQVIDSAGSPITQWEGQAVAEDMYRWRPAGRLSSQHTLWLGPKLPPGPYLMRLGFFDPDSGARLPLRPSASLPAADGIDQVQLGLFYVSADGSDPRLPAQPLDATFGDAIRLIGVTLPDIQNPESGVQSPELGVENPKSKMPGTAGQTLQNPKLTVVFHWQAIRPTGRPQTVFLQLLNQNGEVVSGWDSQPFNGLYPTSFWSPGEVVVDAFRLPLPEGGLPPGDYRLITGFYDFETGQRLPVSDGGDFAGLATFTVK